MAEDKWTVALMGCIREGWDLGDIVSFKPKGEDWTEQEQKQFLIVEFDGFTREEMLEFKAVDRSDPENPSNRKFKIDDYLLKVKGVDFKILVDEGKLNPLNKKIVIKDKTKEIKDKKAT